MPRKKKKSIEQIEERLAKLLQDMKDLSLDERQASWVRGHMSVLQFNMTPLHEKLKKSIRQNSKTK